MEQDTSSIGRHLIRRPVLQLEESDIKTALLYAVKGEEKKTKVKKTQKRSAPRKKETTCTEI